MIKTVICFAFVVFGVVGLLPFAMLAAFLAFWGCVSQCRFLSTVSPRVGHSA